MPSPDIRPYELSPHIAPLDIARPKDGRPDFVAPFGTRRRKVAICGSQGTASMPWDDPTFECWGINNFWNMARDSQGRVAASRWWEQHQILPDTVGPERGRMIQDPNDMRWIDTCPVPLYTTEPWPANPKALVWPIDHYARKYRDYFACTFAMQIVQAFDEGFEELHVHGLELLWGTKREATVESSCVNYWLGYVEGRGMKVVLAPRVREGLRQPQFLLAHPYRYGHDYWKERRWVEGYVRRWNSLPEAI